MLRELLQNMQNIREVGTIGRGMPNGVIASLTLAPWHERQRSRNFPISSQNISSPRQKLHKSPKESRTTRQSFQPISHHMRRGKDNAICGLRWRPVFALAIEFRYKSTCMHTLEIQPHSRAAADSRKVFMFPSQHKALRRKARVDVVAIDLPLFSLLFDE